MEFYSGGDTFVGQMHEAIPTTLCQKDPLVRSSHWPSLGSSFIRPEDVAVFEEMR